MRLCPGRRPSSPNPPRWEIRRIQYARFGSPVDVYYSGEGRCICQSLLEYFKPRQFRRGFMSQVGMHSGSLCCCGKIALLFVDVVLHELKLPISLASLLLRQLHRRACLGQLILASDCPFSIFFSLGFVKRSDATQRRYTSLDFRQELRLQLGYRPFLYFLSIRHIHAALLHCKHALCVCSKKWKLRVSISSRATRRVKPISETPWPDTRVSKLPTRKHKPVKIHTGREVPIKFTDENRFRSCDAVESPSKVVPNECSRRRKTGPIVMEYEEIQRLEIRELDHACEVRVRKSNRLFGVIMFDFCRCLRDECPAAESVT